MLEEESPFDYFVLDLRHISLFHITLLFIVIFVDQKVLFRKNIVALRRFSYVCECLSIVSLLVFVKLTCWTCWHSTAYGRSKFWIWAWQRFVIALCCMLHYADKTKLVNTNCIAGFHVLFSQKLWFVDQVLELSTLFRLLSLCSF